MTPRREVEVGLPLGRDVHASTARRRIDAPVVPYGVVGELAVGGRLAFAGPPDNLDELLDLVLDHDRDAVVGRGPLRDGGHELLGSFQVFRHPTGDDVLAAAADPNRRPRRDGVSVHASILDEHADPAGHQVADRWLARNVALVETPAYGTRVREVAAAARKVTTMTEPTAPVLPGQPIPEPEPEQPELVPDEQHGDESTDESDEQRQAEASAPGRMPAVPPRRTAPARRNGASLAELTRLTAAAERREGGRDVMAALADITYTANPWITPPQYAGELWSGMPYQRQIVPLITTAALTGRTVTGWRWTVKPLVADYEGDKVAVPTNPAETDDTTVTAAILAGAHDIDRSFRDFGNDEFWTSYYSMMAMDYAIKTDGKASTGLLAGATVRPAATDITAALVDALLFVNVQAPATFALMSSDLLVELLGVTSANMPALLSGQLGGSVDNPLGGITIRTHANIPAGTLLVGTRAAATFYELPGSPVRIETVNIPLGGIDAAVHGYWALFINNPAGLAKTTVTITRKAAEAVAWATLDEARRWWPESGTVADAVLADLLDASTARLAPYAATHVDPPLTPQRMANVYDARDLYAGRLVTGTGGELGVDAYTLRLSRGPSQQVRELLRPTRPGGVPMIVADARHAVGDALRAKLPDVTVLDQPSTITAGSYTGRLAMLSVPTVDYLTDGRTVCREPVPVNVILTAGVPDTDPAATWDALDDLLVEVADACAAAGYLPATPANLLTLDDDRTPAWSLTVEV